jgi:hypothetical protein
MNPEPSKLTTWITLGATPHDKVLLDRIATQDGESSMSAVVRRLIRQEAARRGIAVDPEIELAPA